MEETNETMAARAAYAAGLRAMADWVERAVGVPLPSNIFGNYSVETKEEAEAIIRAGGGCRKVYNDDTFHIYKDFGPISIDHYFYRKTVCTPKVVGVRTIEAQFIPARTIEAQTVEILEWECEPILAASPVEPEEASDDIPF